MLTPHDAAIRVQNRDKAQSFPIITCLDDLLPHIIDHDEIRVATQPNGFHVVCYMISDSETFNGPSAAYLRECRGITFYPDGKIAARPLHKFFNVNERPDTQVSVLDLSSQNVKRIMDKRDGSMLNPVLLQDGTIAMKSKKTFTSDVAINGTKFLYLPKNNHTLMYCHSCIAAGYTPTFEYTSPNARIVLNYEQEELQLLHVRDNVTGDYTVNFEGFATPFVENLSDRTPEQILIDIETEEDREGYIFQFANGDMVKLKTPWYMALHHTVTFTRERDVALMVLNETLDDYKAYLVEVNAEETMQKVLAIESAVCRKVLQLEKDTETFFQLSAHLTERKDVAMFHKGNFLFKLIMDKYSNKEPNYKYFYETHYLKDDFGLDQL